MKRVLFACTENAGRSQMAKAFFNFYTKDSDLWAESFGTVPAKAVNPVVIEAMKEKGIDISDAQPKLLDPSKMTDYVKVISFGCLVKSSFSEDIQKVIKDWIVDDPSGKPIEEVRNIRDNAEMGVKELLYRLKSECKII